MKNRIFKISKSLFLISILVVGLWLSERILNNMTDYEEWDLFYTFEKDSIELIHFGSSHCGQTFVSTLESEILGFDVFNINSPGASIEQVKYVMLEVLKTQKPKIVTIEMYSIIPYSTSDYKPLNVHGAFDLMKFSKNKIDAVMYNIPDDTKIEYFFPLSVYHLKWKEITLHEIKRNILVFTNNSSLFYGYTPSATIYSAEENISILPYSNVITESKSLPPERMELLQDIVDICEENDTKLIFITAPFIEQGNMTYSELKKYTNGLAEFAEENNIDIIDYCEMADEIEIYTSNLANEGHLNISGAYKVSTSFAEYIEQNYYFLFDGCSWDYKEDMLEKQEKLEERYKNFVTTLEDERQK